MSFQLVPSASDPSPTDGTRRGGRSQEAKGLDLGFADVYLTHFEEGGIHRRVHPQVLASWRSGADIFAVPLRRWPFNSNKAGCFVFLGDRYSRTHEDDSPCLFGLRELACVLTRPYSCMAVALAELSRASSLLREAGLGARTGFGAGR